jgi:hypothetical protein
MQMDSRDDMILMLDRYRLSIATCSKGFTMNREISLSWLRNLILTVLAVDCIYIPILFGHSSVNGAILGRYSASYVAFLVLAALIFCLWIMLFFQHARIQPQITRIPIAYRIVAIFLLIIPIYLLRRFTNETQILEYLAANWVFLALVVTYDYRDVAFRRSALFLFALALFLLVVLTLIVTTTLSAKPYNPDEAIWADYASSWQVAGGVIYRTVDQVPMLIQPGIGWIHALHGAVQWLVDFDQRVGRAFNLFFYLISLAGLWLVAKSLHGRFAAYTVVVIAIASGSFFRAFDYRPDHFVVAAQIFVFWFLIEARKQNSRPLSFSLHVLVGGLATLALQLHAVGVYLPIALSIFYLAELAYLLWRDRKLDERSVRGLLGFGIGAGLGTAVFYYWNILPAGGISEYLRFLIADRGALEREFGYLLNWPANLGILVWCSIGFLIYRRHTEDRFYLALIISAVIAITIVDTQGYTIPYYGLFLVPIGTTLVRYFQHSIRLTLLILAVGFFPSTYSWIDTRIQNFMASEPEIEWIGNTILSQVAVSRADTIVASIELIWVMPDYPKLYNSAAEGVSDDLYGLSPVETWERIAPDLYIEIPRRQATPDGLKEYLAQEQFTICQNLEVNNYQVNIWRRDCGS